MSIFLLLLSLLTPSAYAYVLPEDVLLQNNAGTEFMAPPTKREMQSVQTQQQLRSAERRKAEQDALFPKKETTEPTHGAAPAAAPAPTEFQMLLEVLSQQLNRQSSAPQTETPDADKTFEELRKERLLQRIEAAEMAVQEETPDTLHSGAPLADTGPGTVLSLVVLLGIGAWTVYRARKSEGSAL